MKKNILSAILVLVLIMVAGCEAGDKALENTGSGTDLVAKKADDIMDMGPVKGGTLKLFTTVPDTLNPVMTGNLYVKDLLSLVFEGLVKLDKSGKPIPALCKKWEVSPDGLLWTFTLQDNVKWHDGIPFTAHDVDFTISTILNPSVKSIYKDNLGNVAAFSVIDNTSFRIILKEPDSFTAERMDFPIIAKHYFSGEDILKSSRNFSPMGTGPFKFQSYEEQKIIRLQSNPLWWNGQPAGKTTPATPYLGDIEVKVYNKASEGINAFGGGEVDVATIGLNEIKKFKGRTDLMLKVYTVSSFEFVAFNTTRPGLSDKAVRQAAMLGVDRGGIINEILPGEAVVSELPVMPGNWILDQVATPSPYSREKARDTLTAAGWKSDGSVMAKSVDGTYTTLGFELLVNNDNEIRIKVADRIAEGLNAIGFKVRVRKAGWEEVLSSINSRKYDMALVGCNTKTVSDLMNLYGSNGKGSGGTASGAGNIAGYSNPIVDGYFGALMREPDLVKRKGIFKDLKSVLQTDVPYLGLYHLNQSMLFSKRLKGEISPYDGVRLNDAAKWYLPVR